MTHQYQTNCPKPPENGWHQSANHTGYKDISHLHDLILYVFLDLFVKLLCSHTGYKNISHPHELILHVFSGCIDMLLCNHTCCKDISHTHELILAISSYCQLPLAKAICHQQPLTIVQKLRKVMGWMVYLTRLHSEPDFDHVLTGCVS